MANIDNWSTGASLKEHERAVDLLNEVKAGQPEMRTVKVRNSYLQFDAGLSDKEIEKRVNNFKSYLKAR